MEGGVLGGQARVLALWLDTARGQGAWGPQGGALMLGRCLI